MSDFVEQLREVASASLLPEDGELTVPGLFEPVEILRDHWGVPYISAASLDDLWFAQGFVTAGERLFQMDLLLRAASGRLSEVFADRTLADDRFARTIGFLRTGAKLAAGWDDASRAIHARFRRGVRGVDGADAGAARRVLPARHEPRAFRPTTPERGRRRSSTWRGGSRGTGTRSCSARRSPNVSGPTRSAHCSRPCRPTRRPSPRARSAGRLLDELPRPKGEGSNDWVVAGSRTATGKPLLANDPHLLAVQPGAWIEMHLRAPGYEARGVALTFSPGILLGTTAHHAWGVTNVSGDVQDLYVEHLNDDAHRRRARRRLGAAHRPSRGDPRARQPPSRSSSTSARRDTARSSRRPRWATCTPSTSRWSRPRRTRCGGRGSTAASVRRSSWTPRDATELRGVPPRGVGRGVPGPELRLRRRGRHDRLSMLRDGSPLREAGDGTAPVPGWTAGYEWNGWIPFDELPWAVDPRARLPGHREQPDPRRRLPAPDRPRLPHAVPRAPGRRAAARRSPDTTSPRWRAIQTRHGLAPRAAAIRSARRPSTPRSDEERDAIGLLAAWDGDMSARLPGGRRVQRVVATHRAARVAPATGRRPVPPLPRRPGDVPVRGPAGDGSATRPAARRRPAPRRARRRVGRAPPSAGPRSGGLALGRAPSARAWSIRSARSPASSRSSRPATSSSAATSRP